MSDTASAALLMGSFALAWLLGRLVLHRAARPTERGLAQVPTRNHVTAASLPMLAAVVFWLFEELKPQVLHRNEGTLSNIVWWLLGAQYGLRWFIGMGLIGGLTSVWLFGHFGWHLGPRHLALFVGTGAVTGFAAWGFAMLLWRTVS